MANWIIQDFGLGYGSSSSSSSASMMIGTVVWGNVEDEPLLMERFGFNDEIDILLGIQEDFARTFSGNWTLENITINGSGNSEILVMGQPGYGISEPWRSGTGLFNIFKDKYGDGIPSSYLGIQYRTSETLLGLSSTSWITLTSRNVDSLGYIQVRVNLSPSSSSSCRSSSSSSSSSSCRSSSSSSSSSSCRSSSSSSSCTSSSSSSSSYAIWYNFEETQPTGNGEGAFWSTSTNRTGSVLAAVSLRLYTSTDSGANWTERQPLGNTNNAWVPPAISYDGSVICTATLAQYNYPSGKLYVSTNSGVNWTERQPRGAGNFGWFGVSISGDGNTIFARSHEDFGYYYVHRSTNGGVSWSEIIPGGTRRNWEVLICDSDASHIIASTTNLTLISTDGGNTWSDRTPVLGGANLLLHSGVINSNGSVMIVAPRNASSTDPNGVLFVSIDNGVNWVTKQFKVHTGYQTSTIGKISINDSGTTIIVSIPEYNNGYQYYPTPLRISTDGGNTWSDLQASPYVAYKNYFGGLDLQLLFGTQYYSGDYSNYTRPYVGRRGV